MNDNDSGPIDRRSVLKAAGAASLMLATGAYAATPRKRYAIVGVGSRVRKITATGASKPVGSTFPPYHLNSVTQVVTDHKWYGSPLPRG